MTDIPQAFVTKADGLELRVVANADAIKNFLINSGFHYDSNLATYLYTAKNNDEKANLFEKLRDMNTCFSAGRDWSPSEVFEDLRQLGLVSGTYKKISWTGPNQWKIEEF